MIIQGQSGEWEIIIGLEVHAQIISKAKLFSGAPADFGAAPNSHVSLIDAAMPGMLPVINAYCVEQVVRTGLGLQAHVNLRSVFDRKNYFYPDLPQGYQISQYTDPIIGTGTITLDLPDGNSRTVRINRIHLEQDAGKSLHDQHPSHSYIDLNRSGVALMEIVSEPDLRAPEEAGAYLRKLRTLMRYLGTCDGNMEEGSMRCDANVSIRRVGTQNFGTRVEIKNVNSVRFVMQAIEIEARRQVILLEEGRIVAQETRQFDANKGETRALRSKEAVHDYRYFPDPDLLPLELDPTEVERIRASLPELPDDKKQRFIDILRLPDYNASVLVAEQETADFFEAGLAVLAQETGDSLVALAKDFSNLVLTDLFGALNKAGLPLARSPITATKLAGLQRLKLDGTISGRISKQVFDLMWETGGEAEALVREHSLIQLTDNKMLETEILAILASHADKVMEYKAGKEKLFGFFVGQVMKATAGKANPALVNSILHDKLKN